MSRFTVYVKCLCLRIYGSLIKLIGYQYHFLFPNKRFIMNNVVASRREKSSAKSPVLIPKIVWQTNFTNKCTFPVYLNYLHNLKFADDFEFRYVSTEERQEYLAKYYSGRVHDAYMRLTDGAAQADLWRIAVLYREGGVYIDVDAALVSRLSPILKEQKHLFIASHASRATNFFLATIPGNPIFGKTLDVIVENIENYKTGADVFSVTGPRALRKAIEECGEKIPVLPRSKVCLTGVFVNEHFQYLDRPRSKWVYKKTFIDNGN